MNGMEALAAWGIIYRVFKAGKSPSPALGQTNQLTLPIYLGTYRLSTYIRAAM